MSPTRFTAMAIRPPLPACAVFTLSRSLLVAATLLLLLLIAPIADAALHTCGGNRRIDLIDQDLADATFDASASTCAITIRGGTAASLTFNNPVSNLVLTVTDVAASIATTAGNFLQFASTVTGGNISIDGVTRTISGGSRGGSFYVIRFVGAVTNLTSLTVKRLSLTLDIRATTGNIDVYPILFFAGLRGVAASVLNVSSNRVSGSMVATSGSPRIWLFTVDPQPLVGFETCEFSNNSVELEASGSAYCQVVFFICPAGIALTGTPASRLVLRDNSFVRGIMSGSTGFVELVIFYGPFLPGRNSISSIGAFIVDGAEIRNCAVSTGATAKLLPIFISGELSMVHGGVVRIRNVHVINCSISAAKNEERGGGVKLLELQSASINGVKSITVLDSSIDMANFDVTSAVGGATAATRAGAVDILNSISGLSSLSITNCSILGNYKSASGTVNLYLFRSLAALNVVNLSIVDSKVSTARPVIEFGPVLFSSLNNTSVVIVNLGCGDSSKFVSACVVFSSPVSGSSSINVTGVSRTMTGAAPGEYSLVRVAAAVSSVRHIIVRNVVIATAVSASTGGSATLDVVHFASTVSGDDDTAAAAAAGRRAIVDVSSNTVARGSTWGSETGDARIAMLYAAGACTGFRTLEMSRNSLAGVSVHGAGRGEVLLMVTETALTFGIAGSSAAAFRGNTFRDIRVTAGSGFVQLTLWHGPWESPMAVSGLSSLVVDDLDLRGIVVTSASNMFRVRVLHVPGATFSMEAGAIEIRHVVLVSNSVSAAGGVIDGLKLVDLQSTTFGIKEIVVEKCSLALNITTTGANVHAIVVFLHVWRELAAIAKIRVDDNEINGVSSFRTSGTGANVQVAFAQFGAAVSSVQLLSAKNNFVTPQFTAISAQGGFVEVFNIKTLNSITGNAGSIDVANSDLHGSLTSATSYVCTGILAVAAGHSLSGIDTINSDGSVVNMQSSAAAAGPGFAASSIMTQCGDMTSITSTTTTTSSTTTTTTTTTTSSSTSTSSSTTPTASSSSTIATTSVATTSSSSLFTSGSLATSGVKDSTSSTALFMQTSTTLASTTPVPAAPLPPPPLQLRNHSVSHTLSENPEPAPVHKEQPVAAASRAAATFFSMLAPAAAATSMRALTAASSLVGCGSMVDAAEQRREVVAAFNNRSSGRSKAIAESERDEGNALPALSWDSNLLLIDTGSGDESKLGTYVGGVISSIVVAVAVLLAGYFVAWVRSISSGAPFSTGCRKTHVPGILGISSGVVIAPCAYASVVLLLHPRGSKIVGGIGVTWCALSLLVYAYLARYFGNPDNGEVLLPEPKDDEKQDERKKKKNKSGSNNNSNDNNNNKNSKKKKRREQAQEETTVGKPLDLFEILLAVITFMTEPRREYKKSYGSGIWLLMIDAWIYPWFGALDLGVAIIVSAMAGVADGGCSSRACCTAVSAASTVTFVAYLVMFLVLKPALVRFDQYNIPAVTTMSMILSSISIVASRGAGNDSTEAVITVVAEAIWYCGLVSLLLSSLANVLPSIIFFANLIQKRCCPRYLSESRTGEGFAARLAQLAARREDQHASRQGLDPAATRAAAATQRCDDDIDAPLMGTTKSAARVNSAHTNLSHFFDHLSAAMPNRPLRNRYPPPPVPALPPIRQQVSGRVPAAPAIPAAAALCHSCTPSPQPQPKARPGSNKKNNPHNSGGNVAAHKKIAGTRM